MHFGLTKDRLEVLGVAVDFERRLREGDSISGILSVDVVGPYQRRIGFPPARDQFGLQDPPATIDGTLVAVRLGDVEEAEDGQQPGDYELVVEVSTTNGEELVGRAPLVITGRRK